MRNAMLKLTDESALNTIIAFKAQMLASMNSDLLSSEMKNQLNSLFFNPTDDLPFQIRKPVEVVYSLTKNMEFHCRDMQEVLTAIFM